MSTRTSLPLHPTEAGDWPPKKRIQEGRGEELRAVEN